MMIGETIRGFELISVTPVEELKAQFHLFRHQKTGAELLWTGREDENKTFAVAFKTIPQDSTGVFHILEHSVLNGSAKYPVKEPFVELIKGSMKTFLNAMTFPDKTVYPIASRNDKDFRNLMSVYLDVVFAPSILTNPHIFEQEGWHYEPTEDGRQHVVGVVYGEMEGAYSSVDRLLSQYMRKLLFPDTCYSLSSGGDPVHIPELTYEQFVASYKRFYHPSNARFFLDGSVDLDTAISDICEYVDAHERREPDFGDVYQQPAAGLLEAQYEIAPGEDAAHKCYFSMGKLESSFSDVEQEVAVMVLNEYLFGSNQSPMKRRVLAQGLGQEVNADRYDGMLQNGWTITVRNTDAEKLPILRKALQDIGREVLAEGLEVDALKATVNQLEFSFCERTEPYGVMLCLNALQSWLYGGDPALYLAMGKVFAAVRAKIGTGYFEQLLTKLLLEEDGLCEVRLTPSDTLGAEKRAAAQARADAATACWTEEQKEYHAKQLAELTAWQKRPDAPEDLAKLPHLSLKDVSAEPKWLYTAETKMEGVRVLQSEVATSGLVYFSLAFDMGMLRNEQLPDASLLTMLLTELPTAEHDVQALQHEIRMHLGSLDFHMQALTANDAVDVCTPYLMAHCSVLESEVPHAIRLIREVLTSTRYDDAEAIRNVLQQRVAGMEQRMISAGHTMAMQMAAAGQTAQDHCAEAMTGYSFVKYMKDKLAAFDIDAIAAALQAVADQVCAEGATLCASGPMSDEQKQALCAALPHHSAWQKQLFALPEVKQVKAALGIPAAVGFASLCTNYLRMGDYQRGTLNVVTKLLALNQLWNEIRVQGGAYGAGVSCTGSGCITTYSYRDPNPANSMKVYRTMADFLENFCDEEKPLEEIIIGVMGEADPLLSPKVANRVAMQLVLQEHTVERERELRRQMLGANHAEMKKYVKLLRDMAEQGSVCVLGNEPMLAQLADENLTKLN